MRFYLTEEDAKMLRYYENYAFEIEDITGWDSFPATEEDLPLIKIYFSRDSGREPICLHGESAEKLTIWLRQYLAEELMI